MADESNPFADIYNASSQPAPAAPASETDNPFADIYKDQNADDPSAGGAFFHNLERGIAPAVASIPAMGAGAELGATLGIPGGPIGIGIGGILGGFAGAFAGSSAVSAAQSYLLSQLPESWQDMLGQSAKQQQAEAEKQPVASFLGGLVPYALTMRPSFNMATAALPENATAIQRLMANPLTAHIFGGAVTGGMELGTEAANHESPDWTKISIATAFGTIFNKPTRIGESLTEVGAGPARFALGRPEPVAPAVAPEQPAKPPEAAPAQSAVKPPGISEKEWNETLLGQKPEPQPTVAQAGDAKVLGPGIDEAVFMGAHEQAPEALMTAQDTARTEASVLRPEESAPSVGTVARRMEPDLFTQYDALQAQRDDLASHPDAPAVQQHIDATNAQINALGPQVAAAYRRAADVVQSPTVEPPAPEPVQPTQPAPEGQTPTAGAPTAPSRETLDAEQASIAQQVTANLIAAGRSPEEAAAGGQLLGHYYRTRSQKFKGALGSPMELFNQQGPTIRRYGASVAPLMPTEARPTIAPEKAPTNVPENITENITPEIAQQAQPVAAPENAPRVSGTPASEIEALDPSNITVDASRFQFKAGGDEQGVSERLQGVEKWDPRLAGTALVFRDAEGKNWIADGHQRIGLAKRLMEGGHPPIKINAFVLDAKDGITDADARAIAAVKNIAEGTGSAVDAAKVIREAKTTGIDLPPLPPRSALVRDGNALAELGPEAFGIVVNEAVPFQQGAIVGRLVKNPAQQVEALRLLAAMKPENVTQAEMVVRDMLSSGTEMTTQGTLFGDEAFASSIVRERAKIADESLKLLHRDKQTFRTLVDEAERIQGAGANVLDQTANQGRLSTDEQAADFLKQLAFRAGPVSDALSAVARQLKAGEIKPGDAARSFLESVRRAVESGVVEGTDAGGAELGAGGQRPVDEGPTFFQHAPPIDWTHGGGGKKVKIGDTTVEYGVSRDGKTGEIIMVRTPAQAQRQGSARAAVSAVLDEADRNGTTMFLTSTPMGKGASKAALDRFYQSLGFVKNTGKNKDFEGPRAEYIRQPQGPRELYQSRKPEPWRPGEMFGGFDTERGLEGLPQTLIPGVKPMTDAERIAAEAAKPLKGGAAPPKPGSLFDEQGREDSAAQRELFQKKRGGINIDPKTGRYRIISLFKYADPSTFFHEIGHQWLDDLMHDAVHPSAPDALKDDAQTVRDWLGIKDIGETIQTRQHEKFATGFEQYLREGVAPSPGLARVFAQLRTWLTQIYQSIKGLGTPINEDIRGVFDRLLAEEPNRTVISPEDLAREPSLPSIHEAEAAEVTTHEAVGTHDRIVAERDAVIAQQPEEVLRELEARIAQRQEEARATAGTEPAAETGASTGGPAAVVGGGIESGAEPAGGAGGSERGPQLGGGSSSNTESAGPTTPGEPTDNAGLRQQRPGAAGATGAHALAPTPETLFGPAESPFVDKAGNIRIENLTSDQDVAQAIRDAAQENNDFIGDRRGVITDGQVLDLADALGMTAESLNRRKLGEAFSAEQVVAARKLLIQSATDVRDVMAKAAAPTSTDEDVLAYAHAKARHQMIQAQVAGITAEAGRALRAFRSLVGDAEAQGVDQFLRSATGKTLFQLKEEAKLGSQLDTPMKVSKFVRDAQKRGFGSMLLEYWVNGLISGPATHTTYMVGNVILSLHKAGPETLAAALIGSAARAAGRKGEVVNFGEAAAKLRGAHLGIPAATQAAFDALRTGVTTRLPGETPRVLPFQPGSELARSVGINESARYSDAMPALYGAVQGIQDGIVSLGTLLKAGGVQGAPMVGLRYSPLGAIPDIAVRGVDVLPLGTVARIPSRAIAAIHSFFRTVNYSMEKNALAYRSAIASGKTGTAFDAHVANMRQNPTTDMMESAVKQATDATLMGRGSEFVQALGKLTNVKILGFPFLKFVDPFVHISGNIIDQSIVQRTPLGLLAPEIRADLMGKNGTVAQDTAAARMLVGTALSIGFGSLAAQGLMSGSGPSDPRQAAVWRLAGNQAHSVRIGDVWYDVHRLGPMGMLASVAADMYDVAHGASEGDMGKMGAALLQAFTHTMLDEGFGRGPADLIQALTDPQRYGPSYVRNQIASFVPFSVGMGQVARAMDPYARQARSIMDQIKSKVPGLSETLLPRRDIWGQPLPSTEVFGTPGLSAIYTTQVNNDPVNQALLNLSIYPAQVDHAIRGVPLTDEQFDQYATIAGGMAKQRLDLIIRSPQWSTWPASTQHDIVESTISQSREVARNVVMGHWPQIASDAVRARLAQLQPSTSEE